MAKHPFLLLLALVPPTLTQKQGGRTFGTRPLTNGELLQAVELWLGIDHDRAEVTALLGDISEWDTSEVTSLNSLFKGAASFDEDISQWNTSSVTDMSDLFYGATMFNHDLGGWQTSAVKSMARMFMKAQTFKKDLSNFDTSSVTDMSYMFQGATLFEGDGLDVWVVDSVSSFNFMFHRATNFNQDLSRWNTQSAEFMEGMFRSAVSFDQNISSWSMDSVRSAARMFEGAYSFNQSVCWPSLQKSTLVENLFCLAHPGAHLDPCCVSTKNLILNACCEGPCDTTCVAYSEDPRGIVSNDPAGPAGDDSVWADPIGDDTTVAEPVTTGVPSNGNIIGADTNEGESGTLTVEEVQNSSTQGEERNYWQRKSWLRILVYVVILIVLGLIFHYVMRVRNHSRGHAGTIVANTDCVEAVGAPSNDEEIGNVETKKTEDSDAADARTIEEIEAKDDESVEWPQK